MLVSRYRILEEIGRGGMATVYLAIQESLNRQVALKVLAHTAHPGFSQRFLREARVVASLNHRHVVTIYDVGIDQERHYISMEYLTGGDLRKRIAQGVPVSVALRIVDNMADALQAGHDKGIVHRDVKPANILFREDGTPLLSDFGVAKQSDATTLMTKTGMILGTPAYLSPEQAHGTPLDGRADLYSLGIVLYEMLTGTRPYDGDSDLSTIFKHAYDPLPTLPDEYHYLQPFLNKLLAKQREDRFHDMMAMRSALREVTRSGQSTHQRRVSAMETGDPENRLDRVRNFILSYKGGAALGVLVVSVTVTLLVYPGASEEPKEERAVPAQAEAQPGVRQPSPADSEQIVENRGSRSPELTGSAEVEEVRVESGSKERSYPNSKTRIDDLIKAGNKRLAEDKTISPNEDSALYYFRRAETLDPGNTEVQDGLYQVASHYAALADHQIQDQRYVQARQFIDRGLEISPGHPRLRALDRRLQLHSVSRHVERASQDVLKSLGKFADNVVDKIKEKTDRK